MNLNETVTKPVKRENSNTTHVTGVTASTGAHTNVSAGVQPAVKQSAFYNTQYKTGGKPGFFNNSDKMKIRQQQINNMIPPSSGGSNRFRTIGNTPGQSVDKNGNPN